MKRTTTIAKHNIMNTNPKVLIAELNEPLKSVLTRLFGTPEVSLSNNLLNLIEFYKKNIDPSLNWDLDAIKTQIFLLMFGENK